MSSLRFAFLAEFAKAEATGTITAVQAGLERLVVHPANETVTVYLACLVARDPDTESVLAVTVTAPDESYSLEQSSTLPADSSDDGWLVTAMTVQLSIPVVGSGSYAVDVAVDETSRVSISLNLAVADLEGGAQ